MQNDNTGRLPSEALAFAQGSLHLQAVSEAANDAIQAARGIFAAYLEKAFGREADAAEQRALVRFQLKLMTAAFLVGEAFIALPPEDKGIMDRLFRSVLELEERLQTDRGESAAALDFARLGACICAARTARGWTLEEAAGKAGCSAEFLRDVERGLRRPMLELFCNLCDALGVSADAALAAARDERG